MPAPLVLALPERRRAFAIVFVVLLSSGAGNTALQSVLPAIGRSLRIPDILVGSIFSLSALLWALATPLWASASDRHGRKPLIVLGTIGFAASMAGMGLVVLAGLDGLLGPMLVFVGMLLTRAIFGFFGSASSPASQAYVADHTEPAERTGAMAVMASAGGLGTILGPAVAPLFVLPFVGLAGPMFAFSLFGVGLLAMIVRGLPGASLAGLGGRSRVAPAKPDGPPLRWRDPRVLPFIVFGFVLASAQVMGGQILGFLVIDKLHIAPIKAQPFIAAAMMAGAVATLSAQWGVIRLFRMTPRLLLRWGAGLAALGSIGMGLAPNLAMVIAAFALTSLGFGLARPGFTAGASLSVKAEEQGAVAGAISSITGASSIFGPTFGLALYGVGHALPFDLNAAVLIALVIYASRHAVLRRAGEIG
jgi:MFS family permease